MDSKFEREAAVYVRMQAAAQSKGRGVLRVHAVGSRRMPSSCHILNPLPASSQQTTFLPNSILILLPNRTGISKTPFSEATKAKRPYSPKALSVILQL